MTLAGKRILVVEDEYMIAVDLKRAPIREGAERVGPTGDLAERLDRVAANPLDAAVLDLNLKDARIYPIADRLDAAAVSYLFLTGCDRRVVPDADADRPTLVKPDALLAVTGMVARLCAIGGSA